MESRTMQEIGMENKVNLYSSCFKSFATCNSESVIYGTGIGSDNIAACDAYDPIRLKMSEAQKKDAQYERYVKGEESRYNGS